MKGSQSRGSLNTPPSPRPITQPSTKRVGIGEGRKIEFQTKILPTGEKRYVIFSEGGVEHVISQKIDAYEACRTGFYSPTKQSFYKKRR